MINFLKKIYFKKKLVGFIILFLSVISISPISNVSALGEVTNRHLKLHDNFFNYDPNLVVSTLRPAFEKAIDFIEGENFDDYLIIPKDLDTVYVFIPSSSSNVSFDLMFRWVNETNKELIFKRDMSKYFYYYTVNATEIDFWDVFGSYDLLVYDYEYFNLDSIPSTNDFFVNNNLKFPMISKGDIQVRFSGYSNYYPYYYESLEYNNNIYNWGDIINFINVDVPGDDDINDDYIPQRRLYNIQIDIEEAGHYTYPHKFRIDLSSHHSPHQNILKGFEFIGLVNDNGLYHWEKTDKCYIDNLHYNLTSSAEQFEIIINHISGDCLDYYERVKLIVHLDNAYLKFNHNLTVETIANINYNYLSETAVADILPAYKYVNFTTYKDNIDFDLMVRNIQGNDFYKRHFFRYFDKNTLRTTNEYVNVFIGPYPLYQNMYYTRGVTLNKNKGLTVFRHEVIDMELFIFEYEDVYYSLTNADFNSNILIIDEDGTRQEVDIDIEYPDPPSEEIGNIDKGVSFLSKGFNAVYTLYSAFYNNLTTEFKIFHNLFFMLLFISIIVKVVLK